MWQFRRGIIFVVSTCANGFASRDVDELAWREQDAASAGVLAGAEGAMCVSGAPRSVAADFFCKNRYFRHKSHPSSGAQYRDALFILHEFKKYGVMHFLLHGIASFNAEAVVIPSHGGKWVTHCVAPSFFR